MQLLATLPAHHSAQTWVLSKASFPNCQCAQRAASRVRCMRVSRKEVQPLQAPAPVLLARGQVLAHERELVRSRVIPAWCVCGKRSTMSLAGDRQPLRQQRVKLQCEGGSKCTTAGMRCSRLSPFPSCHQLHACDCLCTQAHLLHQLAHLRIMRERHK